MPMILLTRLPDYNNNNNNNENNNNNNKNTNNNNNICSFQSVCEPSEPCPAHHRLPSSLSLPLTNGRAAKVGSEFVCNLKGSVYLHITAVKDYYSCLASENSIKNYLKMNYIYIHHSLQQFMIIP